METLPAPSYVYMMEIEKENRFLSGNAIKIIGIVLMTMNHLHQMFIAQGAPDWLGWFGRPVAAMFLFLCAEGFSYTRNRKRYLLLLLAGFYFMALMNRLLSSTMFMEDIALINNIFSTLFMAAFYMWMIDLLRKGVREKRAAAILLAAGGILLPLAAGFGLLLALSAANRTAAMLLFFVPNPVSAEGGFTLILMGLAFYLLRKYPLARAGIVAAFSALAWYLSRGSGDFQWLMITAVIPLMLYNGKRGGGNKYFFSIYYPAHIYILYLSAWFLKE
jgi:hypothetical protein